jgi:multicomponent Na+:H+ antiporter subunit A
LLLLLASGFVLWLIKPQRSHLFAWLAALPPAVVTAWQVAQLPAIAQGAVVNETLAWAPSLGLEIALRLDGLSVFFGLVVTGIGAIIAFYTNYYFEDDERQGYFFLLLFAFMTSMLGLVWSNDLLTLFVFWEGTSVTSYLLIAFKSDSKAAVDGARRALIVTTAGALAMLAGFILLGQAVGTTNITAILATPGLTELPVYPVVLALILLGAFTKSAQWPFHFWLPGAMAAPTPASAYLHSATMVKAGVFLLARLQSGLGHDPLWFWSLFTVGGITMLVGGVSAIRYRDMKALLAYATVSVLGILVFLLAFPEPIAVTAVVVTVLAHALYKAPLFLTAGIVDHAMGTRDLRYLAGLARLMPFVAATAALAATSMAGMPPTFGFLSKELLLETMADVQGHGQELVGLLGYGIATVTAIFLGGAVFTLVWEAYFRRKADRDADREPAHLHHKPAFWFVAPALLLTVVGALAPLFIDTFQGTLVIPAASSILGEPLTKTLKLWHGWTPVFITSLAILGLSIVLVTVRTPARRAWATLPARVSAVLAYDKLIDVVYRFAYEVTKLVQGSTLPSQISITLLAGAAVAVFALIQGNWLPNTMQDSVESPAFYEWLIVLLGIIAAFTTVRARSRLSAIISLGVVGIVVTLFFIDFSAPDLALTQLLIEVLTVILLVLVFFRVKPDPPLPPDRREIFRIVVAVALGVFGFTVAIVTHFVQVSASISPYFIANAPTIGRGENVVNVILVDIRGYDTLGEITVLGLAALGGYALLRGPQLHALRKRLARARHAPPAPAPIPAEPGGEAGHD